MCPRPPLPIIVLSSVALEKTMKKKRIATGYQIIQLVEIVCFDFKLFTIKTFVVERVIWHWLSHKEVKSNLVPLNPSSDVQKGDKSKEQD